MNISHRRNDDGIDYQVGKSINNDVSKIGSSPRRVVSSNESKEKSRQIESSRLRVAALTAEIVRLKSEAKKAKAENNKLEEHIIKHSNKKPSQQKIKKLCELIEGQESIINGQAGELERAYTQLAVLSRALDVKSGGGGGTLYELGKKKEAMHSLALELYNVKNENKSFQHEIGALKLQLEELQEKLEEEVKSRKAAEANIASAVVIAHEKAKNIVKAANDRAENTMMLMTEEINKLTVESKVLDSVLCSQKVKNEHLLSENFALKNALAVQKSQFQKQIQEQQNEDYSQIVEELKLMTAERDKYRAAANRAEKSLEEMKNHSAEVQVMASHQLKQVMDMADGKEVLLRALLEQLSVSRSNLHSEHEMRIKAEKAMAKLTRESGRFNEVSRVHDINDTDQLQHKTDDHNNRDKVDVMNTHKHSFESNDIIDIHFRVEETRRTDEQATQDEPCNDEQQINDDSIMISGLSLLEIAAAEHF